MGIKYIGDMLRLQEVVDYLRLMKKQKESNSVLWESDEYRKTSCLELVRIKTDNSEHFGLICSVHSAFVIGLAAASLACLKLIITN